MAFVKIDEKLPRHPKVLTAMALHSGAFGLYVASICYANEHRTDGLILHSALGALLPGVPRPKPVATALVSARLWDPLEGAWLIHDYLEHQASASQIEAKLRKDSARKRNGNRAEP